MAAAASATLARVMVSAIHRVTRSASLGAATVEGDRLGRLLGRYIVEHALQPVQGAD